MYRVHLALAPLALAVVLLGCSGRGAPGTRCYRASDCEDGTGCFALAGSGYVCMRTCAGDTVFCDGGEVCVPTDDDPTVHVCLFGGDIAIGDPCTYGWECTLGGLCIDFADPPAKYCHLACEPTNAGAPCQAAKGETCVGQCTVGSAGYCSVDLNATPACPPGGPDAGAPDAGATDAGP